MFIRRRCSAKEYPLHSPGELGCTARSKELYRMPIGDKLGHCAKPRVNDRQARSKGLCDHEGKAFVPGRREDEDFRCGHGLSDLLSIACTKPFNVRIRRRSLCNLRSKRPVPDDFELRSGLQPTFPCSAA